MYSVIIPLYNKAPYIYNAITSVLNQTCQEFELIVVNDGSTDDGPSKVNQLIQDYNSTAHDARHTTHDTRHTTHGEEEIGRRGEKEKGRTTQPSRFQKPPLGGLGVKNDEQETKCPEPKIRILNQLNLGVSSARNNGVKKANYDYIAFLDADDWWDPRFLEEMKNLINEFPDAGIYGSKYYSVKNNKSTSSFNHEPEDFNGYINCFKAYTFGWWTPLTSSSMIIPITVFKEFDGFKPNLKFAEDFDLWVRIALKYKVAYLNKPLAYYNQDVDITNRAVESKKLFTPDTCATFNWDYLAAAEQENADLKKLLDHLRLTSLLRYHLSGRYLKETSKELAKVDFSKQPVYYKRLYYYPRFLVKGYLKFMNTGSRVKQTVIKMINN